MRQQNTFRDARILSRKFEQYLRSCLANIANDAPDRVFDSADSFTAEIEPAVVALDRLVMSDAGVRDYISAILPTIGFSDVPLGVCIEYAARRGNLGTVQLPKENAGRLDPFYRFVVGPVAAAARELVLLCALASTRLDRAEREIVRASVQLGSAFDELFFRWWRLVVVPMRENYEQARAIEEALAAHGKTNPYSVLKPSSRIKPEKPFALKSIEQLVEVPLAAAFPKETSQMIRVLGGLDRALRKPRDADYREYFRALRLAIGNRNLSLMERLWADVDTKWVAIGPERRLIPVHMMEDGYHDPFRISPEFRLMWRTDRFGDELRLSRGAMERFGREIGGDTVARRLAGIDVGVFLTLIWSGCDLDLRMAGQSVPNRPDVRDIGMKIFLDSDTMAKRIVKFRMFLERIASPETWRWADKAFMIEPMYLLVFGHEYGHPILVTKELEHAFGSEKGAIEEAKATIFGASGIARAIARGELGADQGAAYRALLAVVLAESLRMLQKQYYNDATAQFYVNEALVCLSILIDADIIRFDENDRIVVSEEVAGTDAPFIALNFFGTLPIAEFYRQVDGDAAREFLKKHTDRNSEKTKRLYAAVNKYLAD